MRAARGIDAADAAHGTQIESPGVVKGAGSRGPGVTQRQLGDGVRPAQIRDFAASAQRQRAHWGQWIGRDGDLSRDFAWQHFGHQLDRTRYAGLSAPGPVFNRRQHYCVGGFRYFQRAQHSQRQLARPSAASRLESVDLNAEQPAGFARESHRAIELLGHLLVLVFCIGVLCAASWLCQRNIGRQQFGLHLAAGGIFRRECGWRDRLRALEQASCRDRFGAFWFCFNNPYGIHFATLHPLFGDKQTNTQTQALLFYYYY